MPDITADQARVAFRPVTLGVALLAGVAFTTTLALWAHYGTAVFYEIIAAGISACF